ncbi:MAG TPA: A/G-specific adenine glycosylase [Gemmatimonadales bacterium]|nr:A/G-specific adenine glycosylase [Gemmatimonadales bacterium]
MSFTRKLLAWYTRHGRDLPWRSTRNPYAILVSEFMLQQTPVSRVLEYFPRFMARFPTIEKLAGAGPRAVMEEWDGLGYYARARNLHKLARVVSKTHAGRISDKPEELQQLPGVGQYTAGAVACFAYEKAVPTVDVNVARVLGRVFLGRETKNEKRETWEIAKTLVPKQGKRAWRFNQALMELGALVCTARKPKCPECPVRKDCLAVRSGVRIRSPRSEHP